RLLMLDEPLGALDRALRARLLDDLAGLFAALALPIIYVTHDQEEALAVGDRVAVLNAGRLEALLPARELWRYPPTEFVARFLGLANIVPLQLTGDAAVATPWGVLPLAGPPPAGATRLLIRPDSMSLDPKGPLRGVVAALTFRGDHTTVHVNPLSGDGPALEVRLRETDPPAVGQTVALSVDRPGVLFLS
ncbi:MAG TPA: TOBE domain-containing protein, partial [Candidatus Limnocylindrales bacterium]|nr:TOBE domain-containing protein [Candidatus Limnocylindrales bacterium]